MTDTLTPGDLPQPEFEGLVDTESLSVDGENPNEQTDSQFGLLCERMRERGWLGGPIVTNTDGLIADGEHRWRAAQEIGLDEVPVRQFDFSDSERRMVRQELNKISGEHDAKRDALEYDHLLSNGHSEEVNALVDAADEDLDELLAQLRMENGSKVPYEYDPEHNVYFEDCVEGMQEHVPDESIKAVVTSPPYNKNLTTQETSRELYEDDMPEEDYRALLNDVFSEVHRVLTDDGHLFVNLKNRIQNGVLDPPFWFHGLQSIKTFTLRSYVVWDITGNFDSSGERFPNDYEVIFHYTKSPDTDGYGWKKPTPDKNTSVWDIGHVMGNDTGRSDHPAQYPVELVERCMLPATDKGDTILDPFMGSGTTAVAAIQNDRDYVGFELDEEGAYKPIIERRIGEAKRQRKASVNAEE